MIQFDIDTGVAKPLTTLDDAGVNAAVSALGYDPVRKVLAGLSVEIPDNVRLFDVTNIQQPPVLLHQELLPTDNANGNGTGSIAFGVGYLFVFDTNNGLVTYRLFEPGVDPVVLAIRRTTTGVAIEWPVGTLQSATNLAGPWLSNATARSSEVDPIL